MDAYSFRFIGGRVAAGGRRLIVAAEDRRLLETDTPHTVFGMYADGRWHQYATRPDWTALSITAANGHVLALGPDGRLCELRPPGEGTQPALSSIPRHIGMTGLATIDGAVYAYGLGRDVLRREADGSWTDLSAPQPGPEDDVVHFTGLAGHSASELYAVGWRGEIWVRTAEGWSREQSPTRAYLGALTVTREGLVYIVGEEGTLLRGRHGAWEALDTGLREDLRDVCEHQGNIFVSTDSRVFRLTPEGRLAALEDDSDEELEDTACRVLLPVEDLGLCSIKGGGVFLLQGDGTWHRLA